jgi:hypothetical protein
LFRQIVDYNDMVIKVTELTRNIIDATISFYGTSVILNEQVIIQDQDPVLSWVSERLGVAMKQARFGLYKSWVIDLELRLVA